MNVILNGAKNPGENERAFLDDPCAGGMGEIIKQLRSGYGVGASYGVTDPGDKAVGGSGPPMDASEVKRQLERKGLLPGPRPDSNAKTPTPSSPSGTSVIRSGTTAPTGTINRANVTPPVSGIASPSGAAPKTTTKGKSGTGSTPNPKP